MDGAATGPGGAAAGGVVEALVGAERVRALFERNTVAQATVLLNVAIVAVVLWGRVAPAPLLGWAASLWLVAALRLGLAAAYHRTAPPPAATGRWARWFTVGAFVNGVLWGALPLLAGPALPLEHLLFLAFVLGGMAAGGAVSNATRPAAFLAFTVPAFLPVVVLLLRGGDRLRVGMGVLLLVFAAAVTAIARSAGRALDGAVRLRFANAELARGLATLNASLEVRVTERGAALLAASERQRHTERELARAANLAAVGALAGRVAHEINNPLGYIKANLAYVRDELARPSHEPATAAALGEALADAGDGVERVSGFVRQLMAASRPEASEQRPVDLRAALEQCLELVGPEVQARARLRSDLADAPPVLGERIRLVQVFHDLLRHAAGSIPPGEPERHEIGLVVRPDPGGARVLVEVSGTGRGHAPAELEALWEPLPGALGAGPAVPGLATCRALIGAMGGGLSVTAARGAGTTFTVWLRPVAGPPGTLPADGT